MIESYGVKGAGPQGGGHGVANLAKNPSKIAQHLFNALVKTPGKSTGKKPKVPGKLGLGLPFHNAPPSFGGHKLAQPMVGGISAPKFRI